LKKIKYLRITFESEIKTYEVPALRGAIIAKVERDNTLFHNHLDDKKFSYSYPLIQYKAINRKAALVCIDQGTEEIQEYFTIRNREIELSGRKLDMKVESVNMQQYTLNVWDKLFDYHIHHWLALSQETYLKYKATESLVEKISMLEKILIGNILSFAKGLEWKIESQVQVNITKLEDEKWVNLKGQKVLAFDCDFKTNVFLPNYIGLGKSVSLGFGVLKEVRK
jgi:hypothetical protein